MKYMKSKLFVTDTFKSSVWLCLALLWAAPLYAYQASDFNWIPPFQSQDEKPSITIIFDNSGSMNQPAYIADFNSSDTYYGPFDSFQNYTYSNKQFKGTTNTSNIWSGNFLNWAAATRADVAKKVMTGGRYSNGVLTLTPSDRTTERTVDTTLSRNKLLVPTTHQDKNTLKINRNTTNADPPTMTVGGTSYTLKIEQDFQPGVIQNFKDSARMALFFYNDELNQRNEPVYSGGFIQAPMSDSESNINLIVKKINDLKPNTWTPLAESLYTTIGYISQSNANTNGPRYASNKSYPVNDITKDPYYFEGYKDHDYGGLVYCTKQNIILITDGESTKDSNIPSTIKDKVSKNHSYGTNYFESGGTKYLLDVAYYGHTTDLRSGNAFPGTQTIDLYTIFASFGVGSSQFLKDATMYGSFKTEEQLNTYLENTDTIEVDNYFKADTGAQLEEAVFAAFSSATKTTASGTAAAVAPQTQHGGDGAVYQAIFFPPTDKTQVTPVWSGHVHALFMDEDGNLREDSEKNGYIDPKLDNIIKFEDGDIFKVNPTTNFSEKLTNLLELTPIWSASHWLNSLTDAEAKDQRIYSSNARKRHIITFADSNSDMVVNTGEIQDFKAPTNFDLGNPNHFYNYLTLYDSTPLSVEFNAGNPINTIRSNTTKYNAFLAQRTQEQINFIRGVDLPDNKSSAQSIVESVRSRKLEPNSPTWRLGDIVYSSPTLVAAPAEGYDFIYNDWSYEVFYQKYLNRRQVVYVGANDGMLHAFNSGFYNSQKKGFDLNHDGETQYPLGMELWAYVPYNLLPHLRWLMNPEYGTDLHVPYMDLEPRAYDVRIFFESDGSTPIDNNRYPNGWGTILVAGMRLGGPTIQADLDKDGVFNNNDRTMSSAYVIIDITDPEQPPNVLAEIAMPNQGFTLSHPAVMPMTTPDTKQASENEWFLVFGSGPANAQGEADPGKMATCTSDQKGRFFILDLKHLVTHNQIRTIDKDGNFVSGAAHFAETESGSFVSSAAVVDLDIGKEDETEMKADVVYYGTVAGDPTISSGKMYRLVTENAMPTVSGVSWETKTLIDIGQPISVAANVALDDAERLWVYFGTGRFYNLVDADQQKKRSFLGIKEPINANGKHTWATISLNDLYDSSQITISNGTCINGYFSPSCVEVKKGAATISWATLLEEVKAKSGWKQNFNPARERVLNQAAVLYDTVLFTSYTPSLELCDFGGSNNLWALYYLTGTPYYDPILPGHVAYIQLGDGPPASLPLFRENKDGTLTAIIQMPDGTLKQIRINPAGDPKRSGELFWRER